MIGESDCLAIINAINEKWSIPWTIQNMIEEIKSKLQDFQYVKLSHYRQQANQATDFLTSRCNSNIISNTDVVPRELITIIRYDVLGYIS